MQLTVAVANAYLAYAVHMHVTCSDWFGVQEARLWFCFGSAGWKQFALNQTAPLPHEHVNVQFCFATITHCCGTGAAASHFYEAL